MSTATGTSALDRWLAPVFGVVCVVTALALVLRELAAQSLWLDEAALALYATRDGFLAGPTIYAAPILHLVVLRMLGFAESDVVLRLPSIAAVVVCVWLGCLVGRQHQRTPWLGMTMGAMLATSPLLIHYGREIKPYAIEACFTCVCLWCLVRMKHPDRRTWLILAAWAVLGMLWTFSWLVTLPALIAGLGVHIVQTRQWRQVRGYLAYAAFCLVCAVALYVGLLRHQNTSDLGDYWIRHAGLYNGDLPLSTWAALRAQDFLAFFRPFAHASNPTLVVLIVAGCARLALGRRYDWLAMCLVAILLALGYAALKLYPFDGARLTLHLWPIVTLLTALALSWPFELCKQRPALAGLMLSLLLAIVMVASARTTIRFNEGYNVENVKPLIAYLREHKSPDDTLLVYSSAAPAFDYYVPSGTFSNTRIVTRRQNLAFYRDVVRESIESDSAGDVWFLLAHVIPANAERVLRACRIVGSTKIATGAVNAILLRVEKPSV